MFPFCFTKHLLPAWPAFRNKNDKKLYVPEEENTHKHTHLPLLEAPLLSQPWYNGDTALGLDAISSHVGCVILDYPHNLPESQASHLEHGDNIHALQGAAKRA